MDTRKETPSMLNQLIGDTTNGLNIEKRWHVLHFIRNAGSPSPQKHIDAFNKGGHSLELFAPIIRPAEIVNGKVVYKEKLLTYYYVFVRGSLSEIKELCARADNNLSLMLNHGGSTRYATITDEDMKRFRLIASLHINAIPFFNIEDIELEEGDRVEVIDGKYAGLTGTFMPKARSAKGHLVIAATQTLGTILWDIDAKYVRILEFAKNTQRQYDLIDSFIPRLYPILRKVYADTALSDKEKSQLSVFNSRMIAAKIDNPKQEAKLLAILACVQSIVGDHRAAQLTAQRYHKRQAAITNPWTQALIMLMQSTVNKDINSLITGYELIKDAPKGPTDSQSRLLTEYRFYLEPQIEYCG